MDARRELGIEEEGYLVTIVNGRYVPMEHELKDGDEIALFPPVSGGGGQEGGIWVVSKVQVGREQYGC